MPETRKLTTILSLDVAGYSRAAERDDGAAAEALRSLRSAVTEIVSPFGGRVFNSAGDGFMLEFPSAASGVEATMALLNESKSGARPLPKIRIGLHLGDVIVEENGDLLGHGVNVAARLQALAEPGSAIVSDTVRTQIHSTKDQLFKPQGRVQLDKMSERIAVYALSPGSTLAFSKITRRRVLPVLAGVTALAAAGGIFAMSRLTERRSNSEGATVAVLPFTSLTNQEEDAAFAAGLHDDLLNRLAQVGSMQVIGRTSMQSYRDTTLRINQIASQLNADIVLEGSVQRSGDRVRVSVQAIDGESEGQRWAESYDRELTAENLFDIQREITEAIAGALNVVLTRQEIAAAGAGGTRNLQAFEANARGRLLLQTPDLDPDLYRQARAAFDEAIQLDPNFASAYAGKAQALMNVYWFDTHDPALREAARAALDRAEALAPKAFETQQALAYYFYWGFLDYRQATIHIDRALEAAPNNADAWLARGSILRRGGHFNRSLDTFERAMRLDPQNQQNRLVVIETASILGHFERAQTLLDAEDQTLPWVRGATAGLRIYQGDVQGLWASARDLNNAATFRFVAALLTRDAANINFALEAWPVEDRRPETFPELYEVARVEALLALGRQQQARALLLEVSARLNASANPYPLGWSASAPITPAHVPGLLGDLAGVRAAERDYLNAPRDELNKESVYGELALAFLRAGDRHRAMHYLEQQANTFGPQRYLLTSVDPRFDSLRDHRRYRAYRARYEAWAARQH